MYLLISPDGMLGRAWAAELREQRERFEMVSFPAFDLAKPETFDRLELASGRYTAVLNCAAWTDVDGAEADEAAATRVNGEGVGELARRCERSGCTLVHYSTDYVFSGSASEPYRVDAPVEPINAYGRSKAAGERAVRAAGGRHLIVRTSWLYAPWGQNFVRTMVRLGRERALLSVVNDQRGRPTSAQHLARTSLRLLAAGARGTMHVADGGECTWFDFARAIVGHVNPACVVEPCGSEAFPRPAKRPRYSVLDLSKAEARVGAMPDWRRNLAPVLEALDARGPV